MNFFNYLSEAFQKTFIREDRYMMFLEGLGNTLIVTLGATVLGVLIGVLVAWGVASSYSRRHPTVDYPLDRYARLELIAESDTFAGKAITRTYVPRSNGGGGGGGSRHGGGGGHRGGR